VTGQDKERLQFTNIGPVADSPKLVEVIAEIKRVAHRQLMGAELRNCQIVGLFPANTIAPERVAL
jgi:hypothetical protein